MQERLRLALLGCEWQQNLQIVVSGVISADDDTQCVSVFNKTVNTLPDLDLQVEEADVRLIPHADHGARHGAKRCVILSGDTDVM